jgi:hypothetical protein
MSWVSRCFEQGLVELEELEELGESVEYSHLIEGRDDRQFEHELLQE